MDEPHRLSLLHKGDAAVGDVQPVGPGVEEDDVPAWSLSAMLRLIPRFTLERDINGDDEDEFLLTASKVLTLGKENKKNFVYLFCFSLA